MGYSCGPNIGSMVAVGNYVAVGVAVLVDVTVGATIVLFDGSPFYPDGSVLLKIADELGITIFGKSAKYRSSL